MRGALTSRILAAEVLRPDYLYLDEWDKPAVLEAFNHALKIGLHPHYCKELETVSDAMPYLQRCPELGLILDTAHQYMSDDSTTRAFETSRDRVVAIHLKDWQPRFGRSPQGFARGLTFLGGGVLREQLEQIINAANTSG